MTPARWTKHGVVVHVVATTDSDRWVMACGLAVAPEPIRLAADHPANCPDCEQQLAEQAYPDHHPATALANYRAGREVWDTNGDHW